MCFQGYRQRCAFIATQAPLPETVDDFWRMLMEQNSNIVVMLTQLDENDKVRIPRMLRFPDASRVFSVSYFFVSVLSYNSLFSARQVICMYRSWHACSGVVWSQEVCYEYWPTDRSSRHQYYIVDPVAEQEFATFIVREFKVKDARVRYLSRYFTMSKHRVYLVLAHCT